MSVQTFKLRVLTPLFMGGADPEGKPELRAASIRGAMRFWFRAMAGAITDDPAEIYKLESEVFGNTEKKSRVVVRVKTANVYLIKKGERVKKVKIETQIERGDRLNFLAYLANMGLAEYKQSKGFLWSRFAFKPSTNFEVEIFSNSNEIKEIASLIFQVAVTLGGFGARWRHGFGSCKIQGNSEPWNDTLKKARERILSLAEKRQIKLKSDTEKLPLWACFKDRYFEIFEGSTEKGGDWEKMLTWIGSRYREFRLKGGNYNSFGHTGDYLKVINPLFENRRINKPVDLLNDIFGLPIQFSKKYGKYRKTAIVNVENRKGNINRRASPLILHVEPNENLIRAVIFCSQFIPQDEDTYYFVEYNNRRVYPQIPTKDDYSRLVEFVENYLGLQRRYPNAQQ